MIRLTKQDIVNRLPILTFEQSDLAAVVNRLPSLSPDGPWLAGGAIRRTLSGQPLDSDFDIFFADEDQFNSFKEELIESFGGQELSKNDKNVVIILPSGVEKIENDDGTTRSVYNPELKIQLINFTYYASIAEVLDSFDFTICQFGFDGLNFYSSDTALWDEARKRLVVHKITYATASLRRLLKYANQGYTACSGALTELLNQVLGNPSSIQADVPYID